MLSSSTNIVSVLLPIPSDRLYSYKVGSDISVMVGDYVRVPVSGRKAIGVVWECDVSPDIDESKIRTILEKFDGVPLSKEMCDFVDWVSHYTLATRGMVLKMVLSVPKALESPKQKVGVKFTGESPTRLTPSRKKVMELAKFR